MGYRVPHPATLPSFALLASALALAGCTGFSSKQPMPGNPVTQGMTSSAAKSALRNDNTFSADLGREYYALADYSASGQDWIDSDYFARKSLAASKGEAVPPEDNRNWGIPEQASRGTRDEMEQQRKRLTAALDGGGKDKYPTLAAQTQTRYDCWVERSEADYMKEFRGECHRQFLSTLSDLEVLLHPPGPYQAYFPFDGKSLGNEAQQEVKQAATTIPQAGTARVKIVAWADRSGTPAYNMKLAKARADAVRAGLVADGMASDRIDEVVKGENDLPVPTQDGKREPKNRLVQISAEVPPATASGSSTPPIR
jgi:OmpA-OmpF porin, OOP family